MPAALTMTLAYVPLDPCIMVCPVGPCGGSSSRAMVGDAGADGVCQAHLHTCLKLALVVSCAL